MIDLLPRVGGGIALRRLAATDLADFQSYRKDPEVGRYQGWVPTPDREARAFLDHMNQAALLQPGTWCQVGIADANSHTLIGDIGLILAGDASRVDIGFTLGRPHQGRGLATAAVREAIALVFENTTASNVVGIADARNAPSIRLLERVGMQRVETRSAMSKGRRCTEFVYTMSKPPKP